MSKEYFLTQKVTVNKKDIAIEHIHSCSYIEPASMEGVKLILEIVDHTGLYRDDYGLQEKAEIEVTFADPDGRGDDVWIQKFIVAKPTTKDGLLTINAFGKDTYELKKPVNSPRFFTNMQPKTILAELLPNLTIVSDTFEKGATYHLNSGGTKSRLIRSMARDFGAACFICRGKVYFVALKNMPMTEQFKLENGNPNAEFSFPRYSIIGERDLYERVLNKTYLSWDTVNGMEQAKNGSQGAGTLISVHQTKALNNQHIAIVPILEIELGGNSKFMPLSCCSVLFHKPLPASELDETLPETQIINQVTHYQRGNRYLCHLELGVRNL